VDIEECIPRLSHELRNDLYNYCKKLNDIVLCKKNFRHREEIDAKDHLEKMALIIPVLIRCSTIAKREYWAYLTQKEQLRSRDYFIYSEPTTTQEEVMHNFSKSFIDWDNFKPGWRRIQPSNLSICPIPMRIEFLIEGDNLNTILKELSGTWKDDSSEGAKDDSKKTSLEIGDDGKTITIHTPQNKFKKSTDYTLNEMQLKVIKRLIDSTSGLSKEKLLKDLNRTNVADIFKHTKLYNKLINYCTSLKLYRLNILHKI